jgi:hypothetical protein
LNAAQTVDGGVISSIRPTEKRAGAVARDRPFHSTAVLVT